MDGHVVAVHGGRREGLLGAAAPAGAAEQLGEERDHLGGVDVAAILREGQGVLATLVGRVDVGRRRR